MAVARPDLAIFSPVQSAPRYADAARDGCARPNGSVYGSHWISGLQFGRAGIVRNGIDEIAEQKNEIPDGRRKSGAPTTQSGVRQFIVGGRVGPDRAEGAAANRDVILGVAGVDRQTLLKPSHFKSADTANEEYALTVGTEKTDAPIGNALFVGVDLSFRGASNRCKEFVTGSYAGGFGSFFGIGDISHGNVPRALGWVGVEGWNGALYHLAADETVGVKKFLLTEELGLTRIRATLSNQLRYPGIKDIDCQSALHLVAEPATGNTV